MKGYRQLLYSHKPKLTYFAPAKCVFRASRERKRKICIHVYGVKVYDDANGYDVIELLKYFKLILISTKK